MRRCDKITFTEPVGVAILFHEKFGNLAITGKFGRIREVISLYYLSDIEIMGRVAELNESNFDTILQAEVPVLVDFWSPTCGPCRTLTPILDELAEENEGDATIVKVNTAQYPTLVARFGIDTLPTLLFFYKGRVVERMVGVQSKYKIQSTLDEIE